MKVQKYENMKEYKYEGKKVLMYENMNEWYMEVGRYKSITVYEKYEGMGAGKNKNMKVWKYKSIKV